MKKTRGFGLLGVIIIIVITALVSSIATGVIMLNNTSYNIKGESINLSKDGDLQDFIEVYETLVAKYYDEIDKKAMLEAAEDGMLNYLGDKYTTYLEDSEYQDILDELAGTYDGIGITIENNKVVNVTLNTPAYKAGILANDIITKVNDTIVENMSGNSIGNLIKNEKTKIVNLEVNRNGEILNFSISKETLPTITYRKIENTTIGYIFIKNFSKNLSDQVRDALKELENAGISSLILDVRDNTGGFLTAAEETASLFLEEGKTIYSLKSNNTKYTYKDKTKEKRTYPIVTLINNNSASAAEILAAALKESYNATLVGAKSYGKGKVQQVVGLNNGDSVKVSTAEWLTPTGNCIEGIGIEPNYNIVYTKTNNSDTQLDYAIELLK